MSKRTINALTFGGLAVIGFGSLYADRYLSPGLANWSPVLLLLWVALMTLLHRKK